MTHRAILKGLIITAMAGLLGACASGYSQFYVPKQGATPEVISALRVAPPTGQPIVERTANPGQDASGLLDAYAKRGYVIIGSSLFNSARAESEEAAIEQGRKVGADLVVILNPRYTGSTTTVVPWTVPTSTTTYSSAHATAYGSGGGTVNAYGSGTSTTTGTSTTMIPITEHRSDYGAGYFIKRKSQFGVHGRDLNDTERRELQSNKGLYVRVVVDDSPAYQADILSGDIILAIDGEPVANGESLSKLIGARLGQSVKVSIYRQGAKFEKSVQLGT